MRQLVSKYKGRVCLLIAGVAWPGTMRAQVTQQSPQPAASGAVLEADTKLVLLDVVVTEKDKAVHGIGKERFHLLEGGKDQAIVSLDEHGADGSQAALQPLKHTALPAHMYSNQPLYPSRGRA